MVEEQQEVTAQDDNTALSQQPVCDVATVQAAQNGDKEAFTQLFMQTYRAMYFTAKSVLSNDEDIYDALQIGFAKAYKYIHRLASPEKFYPWLHTIIRNAALDVLKDVRAYTADEYKETSDGTEPQTDAERRADVQRILEKLDKTQAQVLTLHYYDGLSLADIARMLNLPASTVRSRLQAAKKQLRTLLEQHDIDQNLYGGTAIAMIVTSLRKVIGTDILSAVVAQDMLDNVLDGKTGRLEKAVYKMMQRQRDNRVKRLASTLLAVCIGVAAITTVVVLALVDRNTPSNPSSLPNGTVSSTSATSLSTTSTVATSVQTTVFGGVTSATTAPATTSATTVRDAFTPDYRAGYANTVGNTANNLSLSDGLLAKQDTWLYYYAGGYLQKIKTDGSGYQLLADCSSGCRFINIIGDWIYYNSNGLRRIRTDGRESKIITTQNCAFLTVSKNIGYYITDGNKLYRFDVNSGKTEHLLTLSNERRGQTAIYDDLLVYISYTNTDEEDLIVRDISSPDKIKQTVRLQSQVSVGGNSSFFIDGQVLYVFTSGALRAIDLNQSNASLKNVASNISFEPFNTALIYFSPYKDGVFATLDHVGHHGCTVHVYTMHGQKISTLSTTWENDLPFFVTFDDNNLYYMSEEELYKAKVDTSNITLLHKQ